MTYEELKPGIHHFRAKEVGKTKNPNGTYSRITVGETLIETPGGMMSEDKWAEEAYKAVAENGDLALLQAIESHVKSHCFWLREKEIRPYALQCLLDKAYQTWEARGEFKQPDVKQEAGMAV